jgi:hypothetical protein
MQFAVSSVSKTLATSALGDIVEAARLYVLDVCAAWGLPPYAVSLYANLDALPVDDTVPCLFMDSLDDPEAAAYHTAIGNRPVIDCLVGDPAGYLTHELAETLVDPTCDAWIPMPDGRMMAKEISDPTQGDSYEINGIKVSNFVFGSYFDPEGKAPFDKMGLITKPFEIRPGGYAVLIDEGNEVEVFGQVPARKLLRGGRRLQRRLLGRP